jgi:hypothetical protein
MPTAGPRRDPEPLRTPQSAPRVGQGEIRRKIVAADRAARGTDAVVREWLRHLSEQGIRGA